jgi:hypothetical protein
MLLREITKYIKDSSHINLLDSFNEVFPELRWFIKIALFLGCYVCLN